VEPGKDRLVAVAHAKLKLVGTLIVKAADKEPAVKLGPGGSVRGRVVGADGKSIAGVTVNLHYARDEVCEVSHVLDGEKEGIGRCLPRQTVNAADGTIRFDCLFPGFEFRLLFHKGKKQYGPDYEKAPKHTIAKHGDECKLGDVAVMPREGAGDSDARTGSARSGNAGNGVCSGGTPAAGEAGRWGRAARLNLARWRPGGTSSRLHGVANGGVSVWNRLAKLTCVQRSITPKQAVGSMMPVIASEIAFFHITCAHRARGPEKNLWIRGSFPDIPGTVPREVLPRSPMADIPLTRASLLVRLRDSRDEAAWSEFVDLYTPLVYGYARKQGLQDADAADLSQEVLRAVAGAVGRLEYDSRRGAFRNWLFTIVRRKLSNWRAAQANRIRGSGDTATHQLLAQCLAPPDMEEE
jgi:hypothetical protein